MSTIVSQKHMIYHLVELNPKEVEIIECEVVPNKFIFTIKSKSKWCSCPSCWKITKRQKDYRFVKSARTFKHLLLSNQTMIELHLMKRYFKCVECNISFMEEYPFEAQKWEYTLSFKNFVLRSWWFMSWNQIAKNTYTSPHFIWNILQTIDEEELNNHGRKVMEELPDIYLWIDEHSFRGRDMVMVITDIKHKKVLAVLNDVTNNTLKERLNSLSDSVRAKIKWLSTDMSQWYQNEVLSHLPWVVSTIDKYHLVQEANQMVDDVRQLVIRLSKHWYVKAETISNTWKIPHVLRKAKHSKKNLVSTKKNETQSH
jgi:transposase